MIDKQVEALVSQILQKEGLWKYVDQGAHRRPPHQPHRRTASMEHPALSSGCGPKCATIARPGARRLRRVWFAYSPDRKGEHPERHLRKFRGVLQADAYAGFSRPVNVSTPNGYEHALSSAVSNRRIVHQTY
jgi:hypothetical protein